MENIGVMFLYRGLGAVSWHGGSVLIPHNSHKSVFKARVSADTFLNEPSVFEMRILTLKIHFLILDVLISKQLSRFYAAACKQ